ncbi:CCT domain [Arabidopsis suecica]|uniref:CCT domain n=1 Tax=Arabidopsis suecica TaxID=45249 RepID=A0A8T1YJG6_ARASU|nr:CCT domain [Arabidopsis suecica]
MSSCVSGGGAYSFELEMIKSPPSHNTPSPSSTISESNSPPFSISTRRPRTPRKRPNQTYDEAAALLSTAYPKIFSSKKTKTQIFGSDKSPLSDYDEASQLLLPYASIEENEFLFNPTIPTKAEHFLEHKEVSFDDLEVKRFEIFEDFDAESILDEEIEEGIDSFMGNIESNDGDRGNCYRVGRLEEIMKNAWNGRFRLGLGLRSSLRENDDGNWWKFPTVEFDQISPRIQTAAAANDGQSNVVDSIKNKTIVTAEGDKKKKKKKKKKVAPAAAESKSSEVPESSPKMEQRVSPLLKLDYDGVLEAWSGKESPFSDEILGSDAAGVDFHARFGEIDLFGESGMREASVLRYKEKRRNRLFSKKIRYQVRKLNADQRPRMKGRFVRRPNARNLSGLRL